LLIVGFALLTALLLFLLLPLFILVLLPLTLTVRALTLAGLSLVSFVTHIEFSLAHRIYRPTEMQVR
jgi:FtsH-binding integral membrane protein